MNTLHGTICPACGYDDTDCYAASPEREDCADLIACSACGLEDFPLTTEASAILIDNRTRERIKRAGQRAGA